MPLALPVLRRLHLVFSYLVQFYVHSLSPDPSSRIPSCPPLVIPASLAVPLFAVSRRLGIAPIMTYTDTVLWNWAVKDMSKPLSRANIYFNTLLTGSPQESHFLMTSLLIELRGAESLQLMGRCLTRLASPAISDPNSPAAQQLELQSVATDLRKLATFISDITSLFLTVKEGCEPVFFYSQLRPVSKFSF